MAKTTRPPKTFRVCLVNTQTLHARCGYGEGKTLEEAQQDALAQARQRDPKAYLSPGGYEVYFAGGINC
jgi:hypothetical protein